MPAGPSHPYFPQDSIIPGYAPNSTPLLVILGSFSGLVGLFTLACVALAKWHNPALKRAEQLAIGWFALCGFLHCFFEGYYVLYHAALPASQSLFAQLWKEYSLSDSRYLTSDPFMLCIEAITTVTLGPLSFLTALLAASKRHHHQGTRHLLQAIVCVGHLYGVTLYYGTCLFAERLRRVSYSRPEVQYYWVYYAGLNAPWVVVPCLLLVQSAGAIRGAFAVAGMVEEGRRMVGETKKGR
ncbi:hypothetical protein VTK56DRAFT_8266 [Thermocarpiscus australiensis]